MLIKVLAAIMFIITMSHMNGMVPGDVFKKNVDNTRNRTMLTIVDDAIVNHFCNSGGQLPENLNELMALGVKENLDNNFEYQKVNDDTYSLSIKGTKEFSANSGRSLTSNVFDYTRDENGNTIYQGAGSTMWASILYKTDSKGHIIGLEKVSCYTQYDEEGNDTSDYYSADFGNALSKDNVVMKLINLFREAENIDTFAKACNMESIFESNLIDLIAEDVLESWGFYW